MVNITFLWRLLLAFCAGALLLLALAYYWLENTTHEWIGTGLFALLIGHNLLHRRWWGNVIQPRRTPDSRLDRALSLSLLTSMLALLFSSLAISQTVFAFLRLGGGFSARQIHIFAAYWCVVLVSVHLGFRWQRVMQFVRHALHLHADSKARSWGLRVAAAAIATVGLQSSFVMEVGSKLTLQMSLEWWDFAQSTLGFFLRWLSILGLYTTATHYALQWMRTRD
ncbi:DUF4405 domain-containing protein [Variovorax sp. HJSM1_2]|uniref:DUF4405 domain-containing protein n=1 Tax=Variovorax sp. HJSM1_2 TaxID=3366263 RepID=UPI003BEC560F